MEKINKIKFENSQNIIYHFISSDEEDVEGEDDFFDDELDDDDLDE